MFLPPRLTLALLLLGLARGLLKQRPAANSAVDSAASPEEVGCQTLSSEDEDEPVPYLTHLLSLLPISQLFLLPEVSTHYLRVGDGMYSVQRISFTTPVVAVSEDSEDVELDEGELATEEELSEAEDFEGSIGNAAYSNFGISMLFQLINAFEMSSPALRFTSFANVPWLAEPESSSIEGEAELSSIEGEAAESRSSPSPVEDAEEEGLMSWIPRVVRSLVSHSQSTESPPRSRAALERALH